jgi:mRNA interferase RelE/StbE
MSCEVLILRRAQREFADLPRADYASVRDVVAALADDPRPPGCKKLVGRDGRRIRSGD